MKAIIGIFTLAGAIAFSARGQGTILWDESVNGPLSNNPDAPSSLQPLTGGTNTIFAAVQATPHGTGWGVDDDLFIFIVPSGLQVTSIDFALDGIAAAWLGNSSFTANYGYAVTSSNGDLLSTMGIGPLGSGTYGMYVGDRDLQSIPTVANYRLDFFAQSIPEPNSLSLVFFGLGFLSVRRLRRCRST
jgi:hypothetical protein